MLEFNFNTDRVSRSRIWLTCACGFPHPPSVQREITRKLTYPKQPTNPFLEMVKFLLERIAPVHIDSEAIRYMRSVRYWLFVELKASVYWVSCVTVVCVDYFSLMVRSGPILPYYTCKWFLLFALSCQGKAQWFKADIKYIVHGSPLRWDLSGNARPHQFRIILILLVYIWKRMLRGSKLVNYFFFCLFFSSVLY